MRSCRVVPSIPLIAWMLTAGRTPPTLPQWPPLLAQRAATIRTPPTDSSGFAAIILSFLQWSPWLPPPSPLHILLTTSEIYYSQVWTVLTFQVLRVKTGHQDNSIALWWFGANWCWGNFNLSNKDFWTTTENHIFVHYLYVHVTFIDINHRASISMLLLTCASEHFCLGKLCDCLYHWKPWFFSTKLLIQITMELCSPCSYQSATPAQ